MNENTTSVPAKDAAETPTPKWTYMAAVKVNKRFRIRFYTDERKFNGYARQVIVTGFMREFAKFPYGSQAEKDALQAAMASKDVGEASEVLIDME